LIGGLRVADAAFFMSRLRRKTDRPKSLAPHPHRAVSPEPRDLGTTRPRSMWSRRIISQLEGGSQSFFSKWRVCDCSFAAA
jgi:hypothetical protein